MRCSRVPLVIAVGVVLAAATAGAERPAIRTYTVADGLAGDQVACLAQDSNGFLWIGTRTGLSRFDGAAFRSFDGHHGLPGSAVWSIHEDASGTLWILTDGGLVRLAVATAEGGGTFEAVAGLPPHVGVMTTDHDGDLWFAAGDRLFRATPEGAGAAAEMGLGVESTAGRPRAITSLAPAAGGGIWAGTTAGLYRVTRTGAVAHYQVFAGDHAASVRAILEDASGRVWVTGHGVVVMRPDETREPAGFDLDRRARPARAGDRIVLPALAGEAATLDGAAGLPTVSLFDLVGSPDGSVWVVTYFGLFVVRSSGIEVRSRATGLASDHLSTALFDHDGNTWIGTQSHGLMRVNSTGMTAFTEEDGLADRQLSSVILAPDGNVAVVGLPPEGVFNILRGERFEPVRIPLPGDWMRRGWGLNQVTFFDHLGALWVPTGYGLVRFAPVADPAAIANATPEVRYTASDGLGGNVVFRLWEDSRGDVWIGLLDLPGVVRWRRRDAAFEVSGGGDGLPSSTATAFAEDASGNVWVGFLGGGLARWRNGAWDSFEDDRELPSGFVNCLHVDRRGRLWIGAQSGGLGRSDNPTADRPTWRRLGVAEGLAAEGVFSLTEDAFGRIWIGTLKGVDRLDPDHGRLDHFDTSTGLVNNLVLDALTAPDGDVWFATDGGVTRVRPVPTIPRKPPPVLIDQVAVDGRAALLPVCGTPAVAPLDLPAGAHGIEIGFTAVDLVPGSRLGFEWAVNDGPVRAIGARDPRVLRLAGLEAGRHDILIRSTLPDGSSGPAATIAFAVAPPFWRRAWFLLAVALAITAVAVTVHRLRIGRLHELHRVRGRIAADLHDEMGLSLARVAMLADVVRGTLGRERSAVGEALAEIGDSARALVDAASDMAWALDPRHDSLAAVMARVRKQAADVVDGVGARLVWRVADLEGVPMSSEQRRHLLLILKEAIHNACRHGRPRTVEVTAEYAGDRLAIAVADDGCGFVPARQDDVGQGLASMRRRAAALGATIAVRSAPDAGTSVSVEVGRAPGRMGMRSLLGRLWSKLGGR